MGFTRSGSVRSKQHDAARERKGRELPTHIAERLAALAKLLPKQSGRCAICNARLSVSTSRIDHVHNLGCCTSSNGCEECRRGALCVRCNSGLGMFGDDIRLLAAAIVYLQDHDTRLGLETLRKDERW